jgi:hypothetical protein
VWHVVALRVRCKRVKGSWESSLINLPIPWLSQLLNSSLMMVLFVVSELRFEWKSPITEVFCSQVTHFLYLGMQNPVCLATTSAFQLTWWATMGSTYVLGRGHRGLTSGRWTQDLMNVKYVLLCILCEVSVDLSISYILSMLYVTWAFLSVPAPNKSHRLLTYWSK